MKTILVSPHSDDIAFSLGGSLLQDFFDRPYLMVTVFTKSKYSPCIKMFNTDEISKIRHLEDVEFTNKLQIMLHRFDFAEPPLRGYSRIGLFSNKNSISDPIYTDVYNALSRLIKLSGCELIVSPMGIGNHIDHIMLCDICNKIAKENNIKIVFYEDLHYATYLTLKQIKAKANSINPELQSRKIDITNVFNNKIHNIKLYKTQATRISEILIRLHTLRLGIENKSFKDISSSWFKYLMFLFANPFIEERAHCQPSAGRGNVRLSASKIQISLYERVWYKKE